MVAQISRRKWPIPPSAIIGAATLAVVMAAASAHAFGPGKPSKKLSPSNVVDLIVDKRGTLRVELLPKEAPKTVAHFLALVDRHFYDGILFHRVEPNFVAQAGDPESRKVDGAKIATLSSAEVTQTYHLGIGGSGKTVPLEPDVPCARGTIGLGHSLSDDSGDSQFFINLSDNHRLDQQYTVFARVTRGYEILNTIRQGDRIKTIRRVPVSRKAG